MNQRAEGVSFASKVRSKTKIEQKTMSVSPNPKNFRKEKQGNIKPRNITYKESEIQNENQTERRRCIICKQSHIQNKNQTNNDEYISKSGKTSKTKIG